MSPGGAAVPALVRHCRPSGAQDNRGWGAGSRGWHPWLTTAAPPGLKTIRVGVTVQGLTPLANNYRPSEAKKRRPVTPSPSRSAPLDDDAHALTDPQVPLARVEGDEALQGPH